MIEKACRISVCVLNESRSISFQLIRFTNFEQTNFNLIVLFLSCVPLTSQIDSLQVDHSDQVAYSQCTGESPTQSRRSRQSPSQLFPPHPAIYLESETYPGINNYIPCTQISLQI